MHFGLIATNNDIALLNKPNSHTRNLVIEKNCIKSSNWKLSDNSYMYISQMTQCHIALNPFKHEMIVHIQIVQIVFVMRSHGLHTFNKLGDHIKIDCSTFKAFVPMETYIKIYFFP